MDRTLLLAPMFWCKNLPVDHTFAEDEKKVLQKSRMWNKLSGVVISLCFLSLSTFWLTVTDKLGWVLQDAWYDIFHSKSYKYLLLYSKDITLIMVDSGMTAMKGKKY